LARECGKVLAECRAEVVEGLHMIQYVFGTGRHSGGDVLASEMPRRRLRPPQAVGRVRGHHAVELPVRGAAVDARPSLVEGNTAVFKPSEETPAVGQRIVELMVEAGFPEGVINLVHGDGAVGERLVRNAGVNVVLFTGSWDVGSHIQQVSSTMHDRIVAAEMGSKSAVIVCADARSTWPSTPPSSSAFKTSGQRCVSAGRVLVHESLIDAFSAKLVGVAKRLVIGARSTRRLSPGR